MTVLSAYRPCKPSSSGVQTVYEQHARALPVLSDPRTQFLIDLKQCIQDRQAQGDLIVIGMDLNDPVQQYNHTQFFEELNMKEAILTIHSGSSPPSTTIRNESNTPIDGIWCSLGLTAQRGGYSKFKEGIPSDHRVLWVEFQLTEFFGSTDTIVKKSDTTKSK